MSDDFKKDDEIEHKKEEKIQHHTQKNPSLVSATFIKYFFMTVITLVILFFLASYIMPMFDRDGEQQQENGENGGNLNIEIKTPDDAGEEAKEEES